MTVLVFEICLVPIIEIEASLCWTQFIQYFVGYSEAPLLFLCYFATSMAFMIKAIFFQITIRIDDYWLSVSKVDGGI